jgi:hypothetical protein
LVASKIFLARRERFDGADIAHVIYGTYGSFDWRREMELLGEHWEMLLWSLVLFRYVYPAPSHYVPAEIWCELLRRFEAEIRSPDSEATFRGSLVDDNMFAIDVNEWRLPNLLADVGRTGSLKWMELRPRAMCQLLIGRRRAHENRSQCRSAFHSAKLCEVEGSV